MKKTTLTLASSLLLATFANAQEKSYNINADIKGIEGYKLNATMVTGIKKGVDTPVIVQGDHMEFKGSYHGETLVMMTSNHPSSKFEVVKGGMFVPGPALDFFVTDKPVTITGNAAELYKAKVTGGKINEEFNAYKEKALPLIEKNWEIRKTSMKLKWKTDSVQIKAYGEETKANNKVIEEYQRDFIARHPKSYASVVLLSRLFESMPINEYEAAYNKLSPSLKASEMGKYLAERIKGVKTTAVGSKAPGFTKPDLNGNLLSLSSLQGKYVLVDFWGSWCGPCRAGNPHLKELYAKYHAKGFEILGVANEKADELPAAEAAWKKAVKDDGLPWLHVLNNYDKVKADLVASYAVTGFPTKLLLDKTGRIIYKEVGTGGEGLDQELKKIFGE
ncbi:Thiol-disulfide isomerase or thioredoxin [Chitinophaga jiangningensis]|uniref:Thiol-disulfide isomerase or thioredoxin n=1 Tax=Chitinophaga jiangningensis TaxID=1419482 RepID=A0A1M6ZT80_9BACT|nr:TlpA disulfide reductase family protein [Chitinophaga jiangningensis]SHL33636.1 Thiol-disulfide isomerase or thioredoxin [Chitinophaga jiangningensis]